MKEESKLQKIAALFPGMRRKVLGTVVRVFAPRTYPVCPECGKRVELLEEGFNCGAHGVITPKDTAVINFVVDDGTGTIRCVAFGETAEKISSLSPKDIKELEENETLLVERVEDFLLGREVEVGGRVRSNKAFDRIEIVVEHISLNPNPILIAQTLLKGKEV